MGIMKCAAHSSRQAGEEHAEHGEEKRVDASLFNGKFFIDYVVQIGRASCRERVFRAV